jgi:hypothetical protein
MLQDFRHHVTPLVTGIDTPPGGAHFLRFSAIDHSMTQP